MKKLSLILVMILLTSCSFFNKEKEDDISKAKEELLWEENALKWNETESLNTEDVVLEETSTWTEIENIIEKNNTPTVITTALTTWDPLIEIEDLSNKDFYAWEFYINWKTLWNVDKIEVSFSNETSSYPEDLYNLKQYKSWASTFKYMASSNFKTLDFWLNKYIFTAYSWDSTYKVKVEINIPEKEIKNPSNPEKTTINNESLNISDMEELKIVDDSLVSEVNCENLTDYLVWKYWYSYWNTCRDIVKDKSIWFYVLRLKWENYFYEKHYIDYEKKTYWVLLLETWTWITKDMLKEKNDELKQITFDKTLKADKVFKN